MTQDGAPILCINCGSSSVKLGLYRSNAEGPPIVEGAVEGIGVAAGRAWLREGGKTVERAGPFADHTAATHAAFEMLDLGAGRAPQAVGHRIVHGGPKLAAPVVIDDAILAELRAAIPFAPLHVPSALEAIAVARARLPSALEVACFDTGFHRGLPEVARRLPVTQALHDRGVRRYGFHGLSYEYIVSALGKDAQGRVVIAHLGNGASLVALLNGCPLDTTMGLTPTGGVVMGTRTGNLDPGVLLFLMREGCDAAAIERLVDHEGGLLGISGSTSDMKALLGAKDDARARLAVNVFVASTRKAIGAMAATLGGLDRLVFTGGIGEHAAEVRAEIARGLEHLGVRLDAARNAQSEPSISAPGSACDVRVITTNEEIVIARHTLALLGPAGK